MKMQIKLYSVRHFCSKSRKVICVNGIPIAICRGKRTAMDIVAYLEGYQVDIKDGKLKKDLDKAINLFKSKEENNIGIIGHGRKVQGVSSLTEYLLYNQNPLVEVEEPSLEKSREGFQSILDMEILKLKEK